MEDDEELHRAAVQGNLHAMQELFREFFEPPDVDWPDENNEDTALHLASKYGRTLCVNYLLDHYAKVDLKNNEGLTPIDYAIRYGHAHVFAIFLRRSKKSVEYPPHFHKFFKTDHRKLSVLHLAVLYGDIKGLKLLLENGYHQNKRARDITALHLAVEKKFKAAVALLLSHGIDPLITPSYNRVSPLHLAVFQNDIMLVNMILPYYDFNREHALASENSSKHKRFGPSDDPDKDIFKKRYSDLCYRRPKLDHNPDFKVTSGYFDDWIDPVLHFAAFLHRTNCVTLILKYDTQVNSISNHLCLNFTPLHQAALYGDKESFLYLTKNGADCMALDRNDHTGLYSLYINNPDNVSQWLLTSLDVMKYDSLRKAFNRLLFDTVPTPKTCDSVTWDTEERLAHDRLVFAYLTDENMKTLFTEHIDEFNILLQRLCNYRRIYSSTVEEKVVAFWGTHNLDSSRIQVPVPDTDFLRPLVQQDRHPYFMFLIQFAAIRNFMRPSYLIDTDPCPMTDAEKALSAALTMDNGNELKFAEPLLKLGVKVKKTFAALLCSEDRNHITVKLMELGFYPDETYSPCDCSPLQVAIMERNFNMARYIIMQGQSVRSTDTAGFTPLHDAVWTQKRSLVERILKVGCDVNARLSDTEKMHGELNGSTPLHLAARLIDETLVRVLLEAGARVNVKDTAGNSPIYYAYRRQNVQILSFLLSAGSEINSVKNLCMEEARYDFGAFMAEWWDQGGDPSPLLLTWQILIEIYPILNLCTDFFIEDEAKERASKEIETNPPLEFDYSYLVSGPTLPPREPKVKWLPDEDSCEEDEIAELAEKRINKRYHKPKVPFKPELFIDGNPLRLQILAAHAVRSCLEPNAWVGVKILKVPEIIGSFITMGLDEKHNQLLVERVSMFDENKRDELIPRTEIHDSTVLRKYEDHVIFEVPDFDENEPEPEMDYDSG